MYGPSDNTCLTVKSHLDRNTDRAYRYRTELPSSHRTHQLAYPIPLQLRAAYCGQYAGEAALIWTPSAPTMYIAPASG